MSEAQVQRLRLRYTKGWPIRYIGHLDLARAMERACRRAKLDMVYSQGFNPRPRLAFASALPVGVAGAAEVADIWLSPPMEPGAFVQRMNSQLPVGMHILSAEEADPGEPSLQARVRWAEYSVALHDAPDDLAERIQGLLARDQFIKEQVRKDKIRRYDLRPLIADLRRVSGGDGRDLIQMRLANASGATGRADQVLEALGLRPEMCDIQRTALIFQGVEGE